MAAQRESQTSNNPKSSQEQPQRQQTSQQTSSQQTSMTRKNALPALGPLSMGTFDLFNPFSMMRRMQEELNRAFSPATTGSSSGSSSAGSELWVPPIEVSQKDGNYIVSAELPGLSDEDVTVEIDDDAIVIRGERQFEHKETQGGITRTERRYGEFYRAIPLPDGADPEKAKAEFKDGVLQISVPATQAQSNARQIPIQTGSSSQSAKPQPSGSQSSSSQTAASAAKSDASKDQKAA